MKEQRRSTIIDSPDFIEVGREWQPRRKFVRFLPEGVGESPFSGNFRMPCNRLSRRFWGTSEKSAGAGESRQAGVLPVPDFAAPKAGYNFGIRAVTKVFVGKLP